MTPIARLFPILLLFATSASAQAAQTYAPVAASVDVGRSFADWRQLRQSSGYQFADYARFLIYNPGWPGEAAMRRNAEKAMRPGENNATVLAFFQAEKPTTGTGWARYADALSAAGRGAEAIVAVKEAWASSDLGATDAAAMLARFGGYLTPQEHNRRVDALLFDKKPADAAPLLAWTTPDRQAAFSARVAMQSRAADAEYRFRAAAHRIGSDSGLLMDRLRYLRDGGNEQMARSLAAQPHNFTDRPADVERWYEMLLLLANGAAESRQFTTAYNIARQLDDALPLGTDMTRQPLGVRDDYTSLAWLAGRMALDRVNSPTNAVAMFDRYARGGKSLQVLTKGHYWAARAALAAGQPAAANAYLQSAGGYPDLFYGQLALERLGRAIPQPSALPTVAATDIARRTLPSSRLLAAARYAMRNGSSVEQTMFIRAFAEGLDSFSERAVATELSRQLGRPDMAVWVARSARNNGATFYYQDAYPRLGTGTIYSPWSLAHGITRQESSFEPYAVSHAGARGLMQLMPGTAREQAGKMGMGYDPNRLMSDKAYNVMLGSAYFQRMLNTWNGSVPLAVASYNAGAGNVRKWINRYGDPRTNQVDIVSWIEAIPFSETKGYVQRVVENSVVYDQLNPRPQQRTALHVSRYLGKSHPG
ncbi:lytic transglycosylase domain-containing protein [Sphingomonas sinipercae]|uniref:Lytic transglycosylase domain-containing protein n=1 Tax=Sphingomonas sinipercae TaxID=2714944 RepID=A0A6G7ZPP4_9SPHN|nr:lytic transglycosylase domain-containing protein [Sphingomonas sinipercae]QIL02954.1 lytic transglycosylase domain-containing protein [Sphingomonas sinipercae]